MRFEEVSAPLEQRLWHVTTTLLQPLLERLHDTTGSCLWKGTEDHRVAAHGCDDAFALKNLASLYLLAAIVVMIFDYWRVSSIVTRLLNSSASAAVTVDPFYKKQE